MLHGLTIVTLLAAAEAAPAADFEAAFDEIHRTVAEHFFDPNLGGLDWDKIGAAYADRAAGADSLDEFGLVVNEMLEHLGTSHTHFYTERKPAYFQLMSIFRPYLDERIREVHADNVNLRYDGIGIATTRVAGEVFIRNVLDGMPADEAGLRVGDRIIAVDGAPFDGIGSFEGRAGMRTAIEIQRTADPGSRSTVGVTPVSIDPATLFVDAMEQSIRVIERSGKRIGYVHLWSYAGDPYQEMLETEIAFGRLRDADALVIDLRDGWGGSNPSDLSLFNRRVPIMTQITRDGERRDIDFQWRKPVALLVNEGSRSGKEVFAYGFRKHAIGPVVGNRTAGAVVGGRPFVIAPGMLLYLAVLDVRIDGERLEGRGVEPDIVVPFDIRYANDADPQLEAALDTIERAVSSESR